MCACWANQADGCLCAFENAEQASVTVQKPTMGVCGPGAGKITDMSAAGDQKGHAQLGFGGLALKCSPNPCQACCKNQGGSCACCKGGSGCSGGSGGGGSGSGVCINQNVNTDGDDGAGGAGGAGGGNNRGCPG